MISLSKSEVLAICPHAHEDAARAGVYVSFNPKDELEAAALLLQLPDRTLVVMRSLRIQLEQISQIQYKLEKGSRIKVLEQTFHGESGTHTPSGSKTPLRWERLTVIQNWLESANSQHPFIATEGL